MRQPKEELTYPWDEISPEEEVQAEAWGDICREAILSLIQARGESFRKISSRAGYSSAYLTRIKTGGRNLTLKTILRVLASFRMPLGIYLRRVAELCPQEDSGENEGTLLGSPADLLCEWREGKPEPPEPFLDQIQVWAEQIGQRELSAASIEVSVRPSVLLLEEQRTRDWRSAKAQLEVMARFDLQPLFQQPRLSRGAVADLAVLLAAWSATQRVAGLRGHAISGLACALRMAHRSQDVWAQGFCLQKAAYLAHDLGRDLEALAFIRMAALCFSEDGDGDDQARVTVDRGYVSYYCGRYDDAERLFRSGLARLGSRLRTFRLAAYQGLTMIAKKRGRLSEAIEFLEQSSKICDRSSLDLAHIRLTQARLLKDIKDFPEAIVAAREAIAVFSEKGNACDVAWSTLLVAELLLIAQRKAEFKVLAADLNSWLPSLTENAIIQVAVENFVARLQLGDLTNKDLNTARQAFAKAGVSYPD